MPVAVTAKKRDLLYLFFPQGMYAYYKFLKQDLLSYFPSVHKWSYMYEQSMHFECMGQLEVGASLWIKKGLA
jgi:hypothetical protein